MCLSSNPAFKIYWFIQSPLAAPSLIPSITSSAFSSPSSVSKSAHSSLLYASKCLSFSLIPCLKVSTTPLKTLSSNEPSAVSINLFTTSERFASGVSSTDVYCSIRYSSRCCVSSRVIFWLVARGKVDALVDVEALVVGIGSLEYEAVEKRGAG